MRKPWPNVRHATDVVVSVRVAGLCRTDLFAADGELACPPERTLGHELCGVVAACGAGVERVRIGDRVTVAPYLRCGRCAHCRADCPPWRCPAHRMLGVSAEGAFAEAVCVPEECVLGIPRALDDLQGALTEPVAAALAIGEAGIPRGASGAVIGSGRIQALSLRVLALGGVDAVAVSEDGATHLREAEADFVVETAATDATLSTALDLLRPGGLLVLKSRPARPVALDVARAVLREIQIRAVAYGSFTDAIDLLARDALHAEDLIGPVLPIEKYADAFALARSGEARKVFLSMPDAPCAA